MTDDTLYRFQLRPPAAGAPVTIRSILDRLPSIPGITSRGDGFFHFGDEDADGVMGIRLQAEGDELRRIEVEIPRPWVMQRGPRVFAIVFMLQGWTGWEVYDPQIGDTLEREAVLQGLVAMRQAQMEQQGGKVPRPRVEDTVEPAPRRKRWRWW